MSHSILNELPLADRKLFPGEAVLVAARPFNGKYRWTFSKLLELHLEDTVSILCYELSHMDFINNLRVKNINFDNQNFVLSVYPNGPTVEAVKKIIAENPNTKVLWIDNLESCIGEHGMPIRTALDKRNFLISLKKLTSRHNISLVVCSTPNRSSERNLSGFPSDIFEHIYELYREEDLKLRLLQSSYGNYTIKTTLFIFKGSFLVSIIRLVCLTHYRSLHRFFLIFSSRF